MEKSCFETIANKLSEEIKEAEIKKLSEDTFEVKTPQKTCEIKADRNKKVIILEAVSEDSRKILSTWMFDEENISQRDLKLIISDFSGIISQKPKKEFKQTKKKSSKGENGMTGLFFANRMVNIFPEIKDDIKEEKENYSEFRAVKFTKEIILPKINELLATKKSGSPEVKKLGKLLSDLYSSAGIDVRSIITMAILNNIENEECLRNNLSDELKTAWNFAKKYKGKKVKPEKEKKKSWMSKALEYQNEMENQK